MNLDELLNLPIEDFIPVEVPKTPKQPMFTPNATNSKTNVYSAVIRLLPNRYDPSNSCMKSVSHWLETDQKKRFFFCPSSRGEKASWITDVFWKYKNDKNNAVSQEIAKKLGAKTNYYSLVYVIQDLTNPENNGKVLVWKYGIKVKNLINSQLNPSEDDLKLGSEPCNVFSLTHGKNLTIKVKTVAGYNNYDDCKFADSVSPFAFSLGKENILNNSNDKIKLGELLESSPNISELYKFKEWTIEDEEEAKKMVSYITGTNISSNTTENHFKPSVQTEKSSVQSEDSTDDSLDDDLEAFLNS